MTPSWDCEQARHDMGVYVLGLSAPEDRAHFDEHVSACRECREELAGLAGLPSLLSKVSIPEAERLLSAGPAADSEVPSPELLPALLARVASTRRANRWRGLAVAAAVVVLALVGGAGLSDALRSGPGPAPPPPAAAAAQRWHTVSAVDAATGAQLTVKYAGQRWGTQMSVRVTGIKAGQVCQFEVVDASGRPWVVGSWRYSVSASPVWYPVSTSLGERALRGFELVSGSRTLASVAA